jgi:hypothetical protein
VATACASTKRLPDRKRRTAEMSRRYTSNMTGERYLGNTSKSPVHDLDNEKTGKNECQIDEITKAGKDKPYTTLEAAHDGGYGDCDYCLKK